MSDTAIKPSVRQRVQVAFSIKTGRYQPWIYTWIPERFDRKGWVFVRRNGVRKVELTGRRTGGAWRPEFAHEETFETFEGAQSAARAWADQLGIPCEKDWTL